MPRVTPQNPPPGTSPVADRIRERRGGRGLIPLDQILLNNPAIADGWNSLLGAIRTQTSLGDDVRELIILRVAARNRAAFEWIQHEPIARRAGVSTAVLRIVRESGDVNRLAPLYAALIRFTDASTREVAVSQEVYDELAEHLDETQMFEVAATCASYNMVSRLLVSLDIDDKAQTPVPYPSDDERVHIPDAALGTEIAIHTRRFVRSPTAPWLVFSNSLLTNTILWTACVPAFADKYNILLYDTRGHGASSIPDSPATVEVLADDIASLLNHYGIARAYALIGVSLGGATTLAFAKRHPDRAERFVVCDTQFATADENIPAWDARIKSAYREGMGPLAESTVARWFPANTSYDTSVVRQMIMNTPVDGFSRCARALQAYDVRPGLTQALAGKLVLLVVGGDDGKLPAAMRGMLSELHGAGVHTRLAVVEGAGHLPMLDGGRVWVRCVKDFLGGAGDVFDPAGFQHQGVSFTVNPVSPPTQLAGAVAWGGSGASVGGLGFQGAPPVMASPVAPGEPVFTQSGSRTMVGDGSTSGPPGSATTTAAPSTVGRSEWAGYAGEQRPVPLSMLPMAPGPGPAGSPGGGIGPGPGMAGHKGYPPPAVLGSASGIGVHVNMGSSIPSHHSTPRGSPGLSPHPSPRMPIRKRTPSPARTADSGGWI